MGYYATVRDHASRRTVFAAGPFNRLGDAKRTVGWVHRLVAERWPSEAAWVAFGTAHVKRGPMPAGRFNLDLGLPAGRIIENPLVPNRWWTPAA